MLMASSAGLRSALFLKFPKVTDIRFEQTQNIPNILSEYLWK